MSSGRRLCGAHHFSQSSSRMFRELPLPRMCHAWAVRQGCNPISLAGCFRRVEMIYGPFPLQTPGECPWIAGQQQFFACPTEQSSQDRRSFAKGHGPCNVTSRQADCQEITFVPGGHNRIENRHSGQPCGATGQSTKNGNLSREGRRDRQAGGRVGFQVADQCLGFRNIHEPTVRQVLKFSRQGCPLSWIGQVNFVSRAARAGAERDQTRHRPTQDRRRLDA